MEPMLLPALAYLQSKRMWIGPLIVLVGVAGIFQSVILQRIKFHFDHQTFQCECTFLCLNSCSTQKFEHEMTLEDISSLNSKYHCGNSIIRAMLNAYGLDYTFWDSDKCMLINVVVFFLENGMLISCTSVFYWPLVHS